MLRKKSSVPSSSLNKSHYNFHIKESTLNIISEGTNTLNVLRGKSNFPEMIT